MNKCASINIRLALTGDCRVKRGRPIALTIYLEAKYIDSQATKPIEIAGKLKILHKTGQYEGNFLPNHSKKFNN